MMKMDYLLLISSTILMIIGIVAIYSASSVLTVLSQGVSSNYYLTRQLIFILVGVIFSLIFIFKCKFHKSKFLVYALVLFILGALLGLKFYGKVVNNAQSWYDLGFFSFQPSEFAKTAIIIFMGIYYERLIKFKEKSLILYFVPLFVGGIMTLFVLKQPDLGGAIILTLICLLTYASVPFNKFAKRKSALIIWGIIIVGAMSLPIIGPRVISEYQLKRLNFWAPCTRYTDSTGYQVCNGFIAIKNGGLTGLGFGNSKQKHLYLPEAHTDFIFPIICEEAGLIGGVVVLMLYLLMLYSILKIARGATKVSDSIMAYGTFIYLTLHILINLLGVLALMPLTGVPLPLLSYGGSFNFNVIVMLFICQKIAIDSKSAKKTEKIKNL